MGAEAVLIAGLIYADTQRHYYNKKGDEFPQFKEGYDSKAQTFKDLELFCGITGAGLYVYNLLDALLYKGARYVEITRQNAPSMKLSFQPYSTPVNMGLSINLTF